MIIVRAPRPIRLPLRVSVQDDPRNLAPVSAVRMGIEHAKIRDHVFFVVSREPWIGRSQIGDIRAIGTSV
jgi:hypothetical protein